MSQPRPVNSKGIYHGLPTHSETNLTAIITGANGISGYYMMRVLSESSSRWSKIYCLSRRPPLIPGGLPKNVEHIACDFLTNPQEIASTIKSYGIHKVDYVFFYSYVQATPKAGGGIWSNAEEMCRVNTLLLTNFLGALGEASIKPRRFMLQTGAKNYGSHLGPTKLPQVESDPRVDLEPNFYYDQEDALFEYCQQTGTEWNICMPGPIVGAVPDAAMNCAFPLAVYASVCQHLGEPLAYPGDIDSWQMLQSMSTARLNAYHEEWAVLSPTATNHKFNTADDSPFTWEAAWPRIAGWYGIKHLGPDPDSSVYTERETRFNPRGYGPKGKIRRKFFMVDWAKQEKVTKAWKEISDQHGLDGDGELKDIDRVFGFLDGTLVRNLPLVLSMNKSRKLGWNGFVDSEESLLEVFEELSELKMVPKVPRVVVKFD